MKSSSDDEGDTTTTALLTKASIIFLIILPLAVYQPPSNARPPLKKMAGRALSDTSSFATKKAAAKKKKKLYLTFDDGPNRGTKNVLHIVQDEGVPVSFFIVGEHVFASPTQSRMWDSLKMAQQIALCNHSYSHAHNHYQAYYSEPDSVVNDFERTQDSLHLTNSIGRTPGRNIWRIDTLQFTDLKKSTAAADSLQKAGFELMGWDLEWQFDHKTICVLNTAEEMIAQIDSVFKHNRTKARDHLVLLAHDQVYAKSEDSFQLRQFIQLLKQQNKYELSLVTYYPGTEMKDTIAWR